MAYPRFRVVQVEEGDGALLVGSLTSTEHAGETWIGDGWRGFLLREGEVVPGRWQARGDQWAFILQSPQALHSVKCKPEWDILDKYWGERAAIVLDSSRRWCRKRFRPSDAVEFHGQKGRCWARADAVEAGEGKLVEGGWDHEHCAIQWETIGEGGQPEAYFSEPDTWVCEECFSRFVRPRSLDFIPHR